MSDPFVTLMDCSPPGSFSLWDLHKYSYTSKSTVVGCCFLLQGIFLAQESNPCLLLLAGKFFTTEPISSVQFSHSVVPDSLWPHESQHARPPCPSPTPGVYPNPCPSSQWCHPAISFSVVPFSSCPWSLPASGSFLVSQRFAWGGQSIGVSASISVLPMNTQDWFALVWTGLLSLQSKELSRVFSNTRVQKHQFFGTQTSSPSNSYIHTWLLEKP